MNKKNCWRSALVIELAVNCAHSGRHRQSGSARVVQPRRVYGKFVDGDRFRRCRYADAGSGRRSRIAVLTGGRGRLVVCRRRRAYNIIIIEIDAVRRCHCYLVIAAVAVGRREISIIMCARVSVCACVRSCVRVHNTYVL